MNWSSPAERQFSQDDQHCVRNWEIAQQRQLLEVNHLFSFSGMKNNWMLLLGKMLPLSQILTYPGPPPNVDSESVKEYSNGTVTPC